MSLTKMTGTVTNHQVLPDQPTQTATELKILFDKAAVDLKAYINDVLTVELDTLLAGKANIETGTDTFALGSKTYTVTDAFITTGTFVFVRATEAAVGTWTVVPASGSFTITSTNTESADVDFVWTAIK